MAICASTAEDMEEYETWLEECEIDCEDNFKSQFIEKIKDVNVIYKLLEIADIEYFLPEGKAADIMVYKPSKYLLDNVLPPNTLKIYDLHIGNAYLIFLEVNQ